MSRSLLVRMTLCMAIITVWLSMIQPVQVAQAAATPQISYIRFQRTVGTNQNNIFAALCIAGADGYKSTHAALNGDGSARWQEEKTHGALNGCVQGIWYYSQVTGNEHLVVTIEAWGGGSSTRARFDLYPSGTEFLSNCTVQDDPNSPLLKDTRYRWDTAAGQACAFVDPATIGLPSTPAAPSNLIATAISQTSVTLNWTDNATTESGFRIYRWVDATASWAQVGNVGGNTTAYTVTGLTCDTTYTFNVNAYNPHGETTTPSERHLRLKTQACNQAEPKDTIAPDGRITSPAHESYIGSSVTINAEAWDNQGGSGVERVDFFVAYDGNWYGLGRDYEAPYQWTWQVPSELRSQGVTITIHVIDRAGNRTENPGGSRLYYWKQSDHNPNVQERWIPKERDAYLNQNALGSTIINGQSHPGNIKCSAASMAMALAINGRINNDFATMKAKANAMYPNVLQNNVAYIYKMASVLRSNGASKAYEKTGNQDALWNLIKGEINAGSPVIMSVKTTQAGHLLVIVGWREVNGVRSIIVNDPYGAWQGGYKYDVNSTAPDSAKGRWREYPFANIIGNGWIIPTGPVVSTSSEVSLSEAVANTPVSPPGWVSVGEKVQIEDPAKGVSIGGLEGYTVHLPVVRR